MDIEQLKPIGSEWQKASYHRIYINDLPGLYGLEVTRYKTGNISGATLNGEQLSHTKADKLFSMLTYGKLWYDLVDGQWHSQSLPAEMTATLVAAIQIKMASA